MDQIVRASSVPGYMALHINSNYFQLKQKFFNYLKLNDAWSAVAKAQWCVFLTKYCTINRPNSLRSQQRQPRLSKSTKYLDMWILIHSQGARRLGLFFFEFRMCEALLYIYRTLFFTFSYILRRRLWIMFFSFNIIMTSCYYKYKT